MISIILDEKLSLVKSTTGAWTKPKSKTYQLTYEYIQCAMNPEKAYTDCGYPKGSDRVVITLIQGSHKTL